MSDMNNGILGVFVHATLSALVAWPLCALLPVPLAFFVATVACGIGLVALTVGGES